MDKTAEIRGFVRSYNFDQVFDIFRVPESLATNYLSLIERREPGLNARAVSTMTALMVMPPDNELKNWFITHGSRLIQSDKPEAIRDAAMRHMNTGVFNETESIQMAFQKAAWARFMKFYADYRSWKENQVSEKMG